MAGGWPDYPAQGANRRTFAGAIRTKEAEYFATFESQRQSVDSDRFTVAFDQKIEKEQWHLGLKQAS
jgi:hypothetical protein